MLSINLWTNLTFSIKKYWKSARMPFPALTLTNSWVNLVGSPHWGPFKTLPIVQIWLKLFCLQKIVCITHYFRRHAFYNFGVLLATLAVKNDKFEEPKFWSVSSFNKLVTVSALSVTKILNFICWTT
jgi:hypothetical protein